MEGDPRFSVQYKATRFWIPGILWFIPGIVLLLIAGSSTWIAVARHLSGFPIFAFALLGALGIFCIVISLANLIPALRISAGRYLAIIATDKGVSLRESPMSKAMVFVPWSDLVAIEAVETVTHGPASVGGGDYSHSVVLARKDTAVGGVKIRIEVSSTSQGQILTLPIEAIVERLQTLHASTTL